MSYAPPPAYQPSQQEGTPGGEPPLWAPWYGIPFGKALRRPFSKYADFSGRASRSEYWWFYLGVFIVQLVLQIIAGTLGGFGGMSTDGTMTGPGAGAIVIIVIDVLFGLAIIVPTLAITWRRFHDTGRSGGFFFLGFIPLVGGIIVLIMLILPSNPSGQRFDRPRG